MGGEIFPDTEIVDPGAFCEANFLWYVIEIFSFGFFYSLNARLKRRSAFCRVRLSVVLYRIFDNG